MPKTPIVQIANERAHENVHKDTTNLFVTVGQ
jgi:hypothetical protein